MKVLKRKGRKEREEANLKKNPKDFAKPYKNKKAIKTTPKNRQSKTKGRTKN